jgi:3-oxo-4-pregnene-20-carboxyl-CoA dehydrogenase alpha subunit
MDPTLPAYIDELADTARRAFASLGGVDLARRAEIDPGERARAGSALRTLGANELDPLAGADDALAAFTIAREAGRVALPYPVAATVCRFAERPLALVDRGRPIADHADILDSLLAIDMNDRIWDTRQAGPRLASLVAPFAVPVELEPSVGVAANEVTGMATWWWIMSAATMLGFVEGALDLCIDHARRRRQFGKRIGDFQGLQFQIADAVVAKNGLAELALYTVAAAIRNVSTARTDALALRHYACEMTRMVLRTSQQIHGASGLTDELDISVLCRHAQAHTRLPVSSDRVLDHLIDAVRTDGFHGLYPHGSAKGRLQVRHDARADTVSGAASP